MPSQHGVRQRASICQDCWFWKEMSCALQNPVEGKCANRRPVQGRRSAAAQEPAAIAATARPVARVPFGAEAPEATFSMAQLRETQPGTSEESVPASPPVELASRARSAPPSLREIRSGRAVAASRAPVAQVRIPLETLDSPSLLQEALPGMDQLVERVRQRTAARLSRAMSTSCS